MCKRSQFAAFIVVLTLIVSCSRKSDFDREASSISETFAARLGAGTKPEVHKDENAVFGKWRYTSQESPDVIRALIESHCPAGYSPLHSADASIVFNKSQTGDSYQLTVTVNRNRDDSHTDVWMTLRATPD